MSYLRMPPIFSHMSRSLSKKLGLDIYGYKPFALLAGNLQPHKHNFHSKLAMISPSAALNNKGVILLELGRFADAARCFKIASKMLITKRNAGSNRVEGAAEGDVSSNNTTTSDALVIMPPNRPALPRGCSEDGTMTDTHTNVDSPSVSMTRRKRSSGSSGAASDQEVLQTKAKRRKKSTKTKNSDDICLPASTQKGSTTTSSTSFQEHLNMNSIGRPLWVRTEEERKTPMEKWALSATLFYNLGLSFNLSAVARQNQNKNSEEGDMSTAVLKRALEFYDMSSRIMLRNFNQHLPTAFPIVLAVSIHNMSLVHAALNETELRAKYQSRLACLLCKMQAVLSKDRSMSGEKDHYEKFMMGLLTVPVKNFGLACAA